MTWGGQRKGAGRKPGPKKVEVKIRLTEAQQEKLRILGGSQWIAQQIEDAAMSITNKIKEAIKDELYSCFDGFTNEEVIRGCAAEALVDGFYTKTEATDNKLSDDASEKEIAELLDDLVKDAMTRIIEVEDNGELPATQYFRKHRI